MAGAEARRPEQVRERNREKRRRAERDLPERLQEWGGTSFEGDIRELVEQARRLLPYRENGKYYLMMGYELIRNVLLELGRRWEIGNDVFFLRREELRRFPRDREELTEVIGDRKVRRQAFRRLDMPDVIDSRELEELGLPRETEDATHRLSGDGVAAGVSRGTARIVLDPREAGDPGVDYVLVCPSTDPGWASLFARARALVVERGGALSHGAIVARDLGIPAVVCPDATRRIPEGAMIRVDGNSGRITVLEE
jgi:pyruvate,water dikinase